jgi:hypothetical protein
MKRPEAKYRKGDRVRVVFHCCITEHRGEECSVLRARFDEPRRRWWYETDIPMPPAGNRTFWEDLLEVA